MSGDLKLDRYIDQWVAPRKKKQDEEQDKGKTLLSRINGFDPSMSSDISLAPKTQETNMELPPLMDDTKEEPIETSAPPSTPDPEKVASTLESQLDKLPKGSLSDKEREAYRNRIDTLLSMSEQAQSRIEKQELAEKLVNAFAQIGGALYGIKHGVDMSGMTFDKSNWDAKIDRSINQFRERMKGVEEEQLQHGKSKKETRDDALQELLLKRQEAKDIESGARADRSLDLQEKQIDATYQAKVAQAEATRKAEEKAAKEKTQEMSRKEAEKRINDAADAFNKVATDSKSSNSAVLQAYKAYVAPLTGEYNLTNDELLKKYGKGWIWKSADVDQLMSRVGQLKAGIGGSTQPTQAAPAQQAAKKVYQGRTYIQQPDGTWKAE